MGFLTWTQLSDHYKRYDQLSDENPDVPDDSEVPPAWTPGDNSCAARLSAALALSDPTFFDQLRQMKSKSGRRFAVHTAKDLVTVGKKTRNVELAIRAGELANYLTRKIGRSELVSNPKLKNHDKRSANSKATLKGKGPGIIFFDKIRGYGGSGHISLWDGNRVVDRGDYFDRSFRVYFWNLPRGIRSEIEARQQRLVRPRRTTSRSRSDGQRGRR